MRLAIHDSPGSYSDQWLVWCEQNGIEVTRVNALDPGILDAVRGHDGFLWHWQHTEPAALLIAVPLLTAIEQMGVPVLPDLATCWHYDDKVAQSYLLDAIGAPTVEYKVFTSRSDARAWAAGATWPRVAKLRRGAGSSGVHLLKSKTEAYRFIDRSFGEGWVPVEKASADVAARLRIAGGGWKGIKTLIRKAPRGLKKLAARRNLVAVERGYVYVQEYLPDNTSDTRITIIGDRAFGFRRAMRPGDYRASGSGWIDHDPEGIDRDAIRVAFDVAGKLKTQSLALDFLHDADGRPTIIEISYAYASGAVHGCPGHWGPDLSWVEGQMWPEHAMMEDFVARLRGGGAGGVGEWHER